MNKTITEYGYIYTKDKKPSFLNSSFIHTEVSQKQFDELFDYWQSDDEAYKIFSFENHCLKAKNYVGVIQTSNLSIEILPKVYDGSNELNNRDIFIEMLKPLLNINDIQLNKANLSTTKYKNIFEIFISMFINYLDNLIHKGIKSDYILKEQNQAFLKGKLIFNEHIKKNHIHKERFYVQFDEYMQNRVENKLLKSTIKLLLAKTTNTQNKKLLRQQQFIFDSVELSYNYQSDIKKINIHRGMEHYEVPLKFAKIFLSNQSFTSLRGKNNVFALLFPMEKVFENYVEFVLNNSKDDLGIKKVLVNGGKNEYFLSENQARLEPDYILQMKDDSYIVTDAKWKLYYDESKKLNPNDIYQIFSYLNFYDCKDTAYLFVPKIQDIVNQEYNYQTKNDDILKYKIKVIPLDLKNIIKNHKFNINFLQGDHNVI